MHNHQYESPLIDPWYSSTSSMRAGDDLELVRLSWGRF